MPQPFHGGVRPKGETRPNGVGRRADQTNDLSVEGDLSEERLPLYRWARCDGVDFLRLLLRLRTHQWSLSFMMGFYDGCYVRPLLCPRNQ